MVNGTCTNCPTLSNSNFCWNNFIRQTAYNNNVLF